MLAKEEHESGTVFIHGTAMSLDKSCTFHDSNELHLFMAGQLRYADLREFFIDCGSRVLGERAFIFILIVMVAVHVRMLILSCCAIGNLLDAN
jgi:hypothetical protein